jgi:peptidoglycan/LPS O-acetylase OafA/YrhL
VAAGGLPGREVPFPDALVNLTMVPQALGAAFVDGAYWTLQVELAFYAIMGLLWTLQLVDKAALVFLGMALLHGISRSLHCWPSIHDSNLFGYAHLFAIGILLHEIHRARRPWHFVASASVWAIALLDHGPAYLAWIVVFFALTAFSVFADAKIFRIKPLLWFGALSYPLYLLHQNIGYVVLRAADAAHWHPALGVAAAFAVVVGLGWAVHRFVEQPAIDWARAMRKKMTQPPAAPQPALE